MTRRAKGARGALAEYERALESILDREYAADAVIVFFRTLAEHERLALGPFVAAQRDRLARRDRRRTGSRWQDGPWGYALRLATTCSMPLPDADAVDDRMLREHDIIDLLLIRQPAWAEEYLARFPTRPADAPGWLFPTVRALIRAGRLERPDDGAYHESMICGLAEPERHGPGVLPALRADPDLLAEELWVMLSIDTEPHASIANVDKYGRTDWCGALVTLADSGEIPRERLLDTALDTLTMGLATYRARWFTRLVDRLAPSETERLARADRWLALLRLDTDSEIAWAFRQAMAVWLAGGYDERPGAFVGALDAVVSLRQKTAPLAAVGLLERIGKTHPDVAGSGVDVLLAALAHDAREVQSAAVAALPALCPAPAHGTLDDVAERLPYLCAGARGALERWLATHGHAPRTGMRMSGSIEPERLAMPASGADATAVAGDPRERELRRLLAIDALHAARDATAPAIPAARFDGTDIPRLDQGARLAPVASLDELIATCARAIEAEGNAIDHERALDGLCRLCDLRPADFDASTAPLLKRARQLLWSLCRPGYGTFAPFVGGERRVDLCGLIVGWATRRSPGPFTRPIRETDTLSVRPAETYVAGPAGPGDGQWKTVEVTDLVTADGCTACLGVLAEGEALPELTVCDFGDRELLVSVPPMDEHTQSYPRGVVSQVALDAEARIIAARAFTPLSAPTHAPCWVAPTALAERAGHLDAPPDTADLVLALLRLAPDGRADALAALPPAPGSEWREAIRHALGAPDAEIGENEALWVAAARARSPWQDDEAVARHFPDRGPDGARAARYRFAILPASPDHDHEHLAATAREEQRRPKSFLLGGAMLPGQDVVLFVDGGNTDDERPPGCLPTRELQLRYRDPGYGRYRYRQDSLQGSVDQIRHIATLWPGARDSFFVQGLVNLLDNLRRGSTCHEHRCYLEPLVDPDTPLHEAGTLLLVTGLAASDAAEHGLAVDAAIAAVEDGRLGTDNLGAALALGLAMSDFPLGRWATRFADVAAASSLHAYVVFRAFEGALRGEGRPATRGLAALLALLADLAEQEHLAIVDAECRAHLSSFGGSSKSTKAARTLIGATATGDPGRFVALAVATREIRLERLKGRRCPLPEQCRGSVLTQ